MTQPKPWCSCWCEWVVTQPKPWCSCWCQCAVTQPKPWCSGWRQCGVTHCDTAQTLVFVLVSMCFDTAQVLVFYLVSLCCDKCVVCYGPSLGVLAGVIVLIVTQPKHWWSDWCQFVNCDTAQVLVFLLVSECVVTQPKTRWAFRNQWCVLKQSSRLWAFI